MQILNVDQIRGWDEYTILHEPISSLDLMERAANSCFDWLMKNGYKGKTFSIYCGKGNNGGDGLAIARLLATNDHQVEVRILEFGNKGTDDFQTNLTRLHDTSANIIFISVEENIHSIPEQNIVIDALFGSGLNKPLTGLSAALANHLNQSSNEVIAIDIPSGMYADKSSKGTIVVKADHTLSFQCFKKAFLIDENASFIGKIHVLPIGLHPDYLKNDFNTDIIIDKDYLKPFFKPRNEFAHKGNFGYGGLIAGSKGMMGAAVLAAKACLRSGVGKLTCHIPSIGYDIMQVAVPAAMAKVDGKDHIELLNDFDQYSALAIGPGIGRYPDHKKTLSNLFGQFSKPIVIDADGLNSLAGEKELLESIPPNAVLTPHPKEFERVFGQVTDDFERIKIAQQKANALQIVIVLKGHHTVIVSPGNRCYYNNTGNAGLAKGGSGDVLTGIILALLCHGYDSTQAACFAVWLHGRAADIAVNDHSYESLMPEDVINSIGKVFRELY